jgi:transposase
MHAGFPPSVATRRITDSERVVPFACSDDFDARGSRRRPAPDAAMTRRKMCAPSAPVSSRTRKVGNQVAEAIRYGLSHRDGLVRFLDNGRIEIDSNTVERCIRPIALNRKNALFAGSDEGGASWAIVASLIETCKLNGVNPHARLTDTLTKLVNLWPDARIDELMPWAYAKIPGDTVKV